MPVFDSSQCCFLNPPDCPLQSVEALELSGGSEQPEYQKCLSRSCLLQVMSYMELGQYDKALAFVEQALAVCLRVAININVNDVSTRKRSPN